MNDLEGDMWYWYHSVSECYYHIQLTIKYRRSVLEPNVQNVIKDTVKEFKERYALEVTTIGFDQNHIHILCRFLPKYSGGQVIHLIKNMTSKAVFLQIPSVKKQLWGGEFWTDGYYIATVSGRGSRVVIETYIKNQGREADIKQLTLFDI